MMTERREILIAGIGNIFLSDDGFGVEVANRLAARSLPSGVRVEDFGIRGVHLAYELLNGYDSLILVDAVPMNEPPGTIAVLEPTLDRVSDDEDEAALAIDSHVMSPDIVLATLSHLGGSVRCIRIVGCQPANLDEGMGLSAPVAEAVERAADVCVELMADIMKAEGERTSR